MTQDPMLYASSYHAPVLVAEVLEHLAVRPGGLYVDGTLGGGGHSHAMLDASAPNGRVLGLDRDPEAIAQASGRLESYGARFQTALVNYGDALQAAQAREFGPVDGFLVDAGVSSHQLQKADRGFSFMQEGPLDMRMGPDTASLADFLDGTDDEELARVLRNYGEIKGAYRTAQAILEARLGGRLNTTAELRRVVEGQLGHGAGSGRRTTIHPATLVFQALRMAVNEELAHLERTVMGVPDLVRKGGRAVFISFHSLEDRVIKQGFRQLADPCDCPAGLHTCVCGKMPRVRILTGRPVTASEAELARNPRARSAKLRAVIVI